MKHTSCSENGFVLRLNQAFAPALCKPIVKIGLGLIVGAWITGSISCIGSKTIGYKVESLLPPKLPGHRVLKPLIGFAYLPS